MILRTERWQSFIPRANCLFVLNYSGKKTERNTGRQFGYISTKEFQNTGAVKGSSFIYGHMKGFGYTEYIYENVAGLAWSLPSASVGTMTGKYVGQGIASPNSFIGLGETDFVGAGVSLGIWNSYDNNNKILWQGEMAGIGISIPVGKLTDKIKNAFLRLITNSVGDISGGTIKTDTKIVFPAISLKTKNIFETSYDKTN